MRETKVNLKHLLENIRDSYAIPLEEVIVVELIANALDSGASTISFSIDEPNNTFSIVDNGKGMRREVIADYHNIAATTKIRGKGIGFAGVGAKLSLLIANAVITETKGGYGSRCATEWYLKSDASAPWKFIPSSGKVPTPRGTAVSIVLPNNRFSLLSKEFLIETIYNHFYSLFHPQIFQSILKHVYRKGIEFYVNNQKISFSHKTNFKPEVFQIKIGKGRSKKLAGAGYLTKGSDKQDMINHGLAISTFGKIIKSGWEWIGISPKQDFSICGVVEIPALAEILTTNKMDFLKDTASLKKYYTFRKTIQQAVMPLLENLGEEVNILDKQKSFRSLSNEIERALRYVLGDFPELAPLFNFRNLNKLGPSFASSTEPPLISIIDKNPETTENQIKQSILKNKTDEESVRSANSQTDKVKNKKGKRGPVFSIVFEKARKDSALARMIENRIFINSSHPAYIKAQEKKQEPYHIVLCTALALSNFLEDNHSPQKFISDFLASWGRGDRTTSRLLEI